jgi:hypothetical protein
MKKEQTIITLLIELDKILKLDNEKDAMSTLYYSPQDTTYQEDASRTKYARSIYRARKLLGLSLEVKQGALLEEEEKDDFSNLLQKNQKSPS